MTAKRSVVAALPSARTPSDQDDREALFAALLQSSGDFLFWQGLSQQTYLNDAAAQMVGIDDGSLPLDVGIPELFTSESRARLIEVGIPTMEATGSWRGHLSLRNRRDGTLHALEWSMFLVHDADGTKVGAAGIGSVVTDHQQILEQMRSSESRFRSLFEFSPLGIAVCDDELRLTQTNPALVEMTGHHTRELVGRDIDTLLTALPEGNRRSISTLIAAEETSVECILKGRRGERHVGLTASWMPLHEDRNDRLVVMLEDISERFAARERLRELAEHDGLTGLANRGSLMTAVNRAQVDAATAHTNLALLYIDIDHFKNVNDTLGHDTGDSLLQAIAKTINGAVRPADLPARIGGDEFAVLC